MAETRTTGMLSDIVPHLVAILAIVISPLSAIIEELFLIDLVGDRVRAVWLSYVGLMIVGTYALSLNS
jgi:hypothetical protein